MSRKKVDRIETELHVVDINAKGLGVAKNKEGAVYFIKDVIPGDVVDVQVYKKGRRYFEANPIKWIKKSPQRTVPPCDHFGVCGGCKLQHLSYEGQLSFKEKGVLHNLSNIGKIDIETVLPIAASKNPYYYRNKMEFSFSNKRWLTSEEIAGENKIERNGLGFHKPGMWDKIVDINHCHLQADPSNKIRNAIKLFAIQEQLDFFDTREQKGFLRTLVIRNTLGGELMVLIQFFKEDQEKRRLLLDFLKNEFPEIKSLLYCINKKGNDSLYDQNIICYYGQNFITEHLNGLQFKISAKSFYQTNPKQAEVLYTIGKEFADLKGNEIVYDLYSGTGTIALFLAEKCAKVIGIESVPDAIEAANENARFNQIENAFFEVGDMKNCFNDSFIERHGKADVVITDPPRNGMHSDVVNQLLKLNPSKIVYISCNSSTQARDLEIMKEFYSVIKSQAVDMFPQTHHVENVVLLQRKINR
ncbi:23S rRNA (uracil(1939)-C(5))-methyltransferase RlmD [Flavobacteriaceae bacterium]|nr:23S rRNA (uracil(1939)-C(5))-methyltransferase RlmD [Flavobacteriaceae bacterium]